MAKKITIEMTVKQTAIGGEAEKMKKAANPIQKGTALNRE